MSATFCPSCHWPTDGCTCPPAPPVYPDGLPGHAKHDDTSTLAAVAQLPRLTAMQLAVLHVLDEADDGGLTDDEGHTVADLNRYTYAPRRCELAKRGLVVRTKERRPTNTGSAAAVWAITDEGRGEHDVKLSLCALCAPEE